MEQRREEMMRKMGGRGRGRGHSFLAGMVVGLVLAGMVGVAYAAQSILFVQTAAGVVVPWPVNGSGIPLMACS